MAVDRSLAYLTAPVHMGNIPVPKKRVYLIERVSSSDTTEQAKAFSQDVSDMLQATCDARICVWRQGHSGKLQELGLVHG